MKRKRKNLVEVEFRTCGSHYLVSGRSFAQQLCEWGHLVPCLLPQNDTNPILLRNPENDQLLCFIPLTVLPHDTGRYGFFLPPRSLKMPKETVMVLRKGDPYPGPSSDPSAEQTVMDELAEEIGRSLFRDRGNPSRIRRSLVRSLRTLTLPDSGAAPAIALGVQYSAGHLGLLALRQGKEPPVSLYRIESGEEGLRCSLETDPEVLGSPVDPTMGEQIAQAVEDMQLTAPASRFRTAGEPPAKEKE